MTILIYDRIKDNPNFRLFKFLDELKIKSNDLNGFEVLVKIDKDDNLLIQQINKLETYPFKIKYLVDEKGNIEFDTHIFYNKLLPLANGGTVAFIPIIGSVYLDKAWDKLIKETIQEQIGIKDKFYIIQGVPHPPYGRKDYDKEKFSIGDWIPLERLNSLEIIPVFNKGLIYLMGGFGPIALIPIWSYLLQRELWQKYKVKITHFTRNIYSREEEEKLTDEQFNRKEADIQIQYNLIRSPYFKQLIESQAQKIAYYVTYTEERLESIRFQNELKTREEDMTIRAKKMNHKFNTIKDELMNGFHKGLNELNQEIKEFRENMEKLWNL